MTFISKLHWTLLKRVRNVYARQEEPKPYEDNTKTTHKSRADTNMEPDKKKAHGELVTLFLPTFSVFSFLMFLNICQQIA